MTGPKGFSRQVPPNVTLSGGIGAFRGVIPTARIASLLDATGLPSTSRRLTCVGDATPIPAWDEPGGGATETCLDGTAPEQFSSVQPSVQVFAPGYEVPVSWRGNLGLDGIAFRGWRFGVNGTYSLGVNGESGIDLNLRRTPVFTLPDEGGRPVFVSEESIVPATGAVAPGASRITDHYGRVTSLVSDLRSVATQLQLTAAPTRLLFGKVPISGSYTYSRQRAQERGFVGSTAGDPFVREWARGRQPTHQVQLTTYARLRWVALALRLDAQSGTTYTPQIVGDVNGDGSSNDRAFIPDPSTIADPALAEQMNALLSSAPPRARACLREQLGEMAGRNSCRTGWVLRPDVNLSVGPPQDFGVGSRLRFSMTMINATGALFRVLGLADSPLARAATPTMPDPTLLYVTGFDPAAQRFSYRVNQQFGDALSFGRRGRQFTAPFQVQLGLEYRFGGPPRDRMTRSLGLVRDKGEAPLTADEVRQRLRRLNSNPVELVLGRRDSLKLSGAQVDSIEAIAAEFTARADSAMAPLVTYLLEHGGKVTDAEVTRRLSQLGPAMRESMLAATGRVEKVLTEEQRQQLPPWFFSGGAGALQRPGGPRR